MNNNVNASKENSGKTLLITLLVGFSAVGCAIVILLALIDKIPSWGYWFIIPGIVLFLLEMKVSSGLNAGSENKIRDGLINKKLIKKNNPGYSFTMKKSDDFNRGNYYLAATEESLLIIDFGTAYKLQMKVNYNNIKTFKLIQKRKTSRFILELKNGKEYTFYKAESMKFLFRLQSFVAFIKKMQKHTKVEEV